VDAKQIAKLMEIKQKQPRLDARTNWWHYRRTAATTYRDAVWQYMDRMTEDGWTQVPTPSMDVLARLVPKGTCTDSGLHWRGFHDPAEYERGC
jgi:hypothetical protein